MLHNYLVNLVVGYIRANKMSLVPKHCDPETYFPAGHLHVQEDFSKPGKHEVHFVGDKHVAQGALHSINII